jgi:hypothetical protein
MSSENPIENKSAIAYALIHNQFINSSIHQFINSSMQTQNIAKILFVLNQCNSALASR